MKSNSAAPERILAMGLYSTGKTSAHLKIAKQYRDSDTDGQFHILDTDNTTGRSLDGYAGWQKNTDIITPSDWTDYIDALEKWGYNKANKRWDASPNDWVVIDSGDKAWDEVQAFYVSMTKGKEIDEFFLDFKKGGGTGSPLSGDYGDQWQVINKLYAAWINALLRFPGHLYVCTPSQDLSLPDSKTGKGGDSKEMIETFRRFNVRPQGQKNLAFQFHTVLLMQTRGLQKPEFYITSVKDRERELLVDQKYTNFPFDYLVSVAGWEL